MLLELRPDTPKTDHNRRGKSRNWGRIMLVSARTVFGGLFFGVLASERFGLTGALIGFILGALLGYYGWNPIWPAESETSKPPPNQSKEPPVHLININTARVEELENLPGIGPSIARKIIKYREHQGHFSQIEDIMMVPGIGPSTFRRIKNLITV